MPFNSLLLQGLLPNLRVKDNGVEVFIDGVEKGEAVFLFSSDNINLDFKSVYLRKHQKDKGTPSSCDAICVYSNDVTHEKNKPPHVIITFIELKGGFADCLKDASNQILITRESIEAGLKNDTELTTLGNIKWKALIVQESGLADRDRQEKMKELIRKFKKENVKVHSIKIDSKNIYDFIST